MQHEIRAPKFGMSGTEIEIVSVAVAVGDQVSSGDVVIEAASDKVDFSIEAEDTGIVAEILVAEGDSCEMGAVVIRLDA